LKLQQDTSFQMHPMKSIKILNTVFLAITNTIRTMINDKYVLL